MRIRYLILTFTFLPAWAFGQSHQEPAGWLERARYSLQVNFQQGGVFKTNDFVKGINAASLPLDFHQGVSVRLARQTTGEKLWERLYDHPAFGIGFYKEDYRQPELGDPAAIYGFLTGPFFRLGWFSLTYDFAIGLSFHWNKYHPLNNRYNIAIGSDINCIVEGSAAAEARILPGFHVVAGYGMTHFSNGGIILPNRGINNHFFKTGMRYEFIQNRPYVHKEKRVKFKGANEWILAAYMGFRMADIPVAPVAGKKLPVVPVFATGIFAYWHRQLDLKSRLGAGFQLGYNGLVNPIFEPVPDTIELNRQPDIRRIEISVFPSYEIAFDRFSLYAQAGFYLHRNGLILNGPVFHQRIGFKYYFTQHLFGSITIRAHKFGKAQMIEWTLGYRL